MNPELDRQESSSDDPIGESFNQQSIYLPSADPDESVANLDFPEVAGASTAQSAESMQPTVNPTDATDVSMSDTSESLGSEPSPDISTSIDKMIADNNQGFAATIPIDTSSKKPKRKKMIIGVVLALLVAVLLGAGAVLALVYDKPENVIGDSLMKMATAESGSVKTVITNTNQGEASSFKLTTNINDQLQTHTTLTGALSLMESELKLDFEFVTNRFEDVYLKADGLIDIYSQFMALYLGMALPDDEQGTSNSNNLDNAIEGVNGKWIKFSVEDLDPESKAEVYKAYQCYQNTHQTFKSDKEAQKELLEVLKEHQMFDIESVGRETVNDKMANHYKISPVENIDQVSKQFAKGLIDTKVFKMVDQCSDQDLAKEFREEIERVDNEDTSFDQPEIDTVVEYWVDTVNHQPLRLKVVSTTNEVTTEVTSDIQLNTNPKVDIPTDVKTFDEVQNEIMQAMMEQYGEEEVMSPVPLNTPVLGVSWLN